MRIYKQAMLSVAMAATFFLVACSSTPIDTPVSATTASASPPASASHAVTKPTGPAVVTAAPLPSVAAKLNVQ